MSAVPKRTCGRIGVSGAKLRCAAHTQQVHETCSPSGRTTTVHRATIVPQECPTRHSVRRRRARKDSAAVCGRSQPSAAPRRQPQRTASAASRQLAVAAPGCNRRRCVATDGAALQRMPLRATAGGAMRRAVHRCRLRCDATRSACPVGPTLRVLWGYSRGAPGRCNGLRWDATGNAAIQHDEQRCSGRGTPVCAHAQQRLPHWKRRIVVGNAPESLKATPKCMKARALAVACVSRCVCVRAWMCVSLCLVVCVFTPGSVCVCVRTD